MSPKTAKKSNLLERNVEHLLQLCDIPYERQKSIDGYNVGFFIEHQKCKVAIECVHREKNSENIRNFIHIWESQQRVLGIDNVVLVLVDCELTEKEEKLAKQFGMEIWDEERLMGLLEVAAEKKSDSKSDILKDAGLKIREPRALDIKITSRKPEVAVPSYAEPPHIKSASEKRASRARIEKKIPARESAAPEMRADTKKAEAIRHDLGEMLRHGERGRDIIVFKDRKSGRAVRHALEHDGFVLACPFGVGKSLYNLGHTEALKRLLSSHSFTEVSDGEDLKEDQFVASDEGVFAHCGTDLNKVATITDGVFRDVHARQDYEAIVIAEKRAAA